MLFIGSSWTGEAQTASLPIATRTAFKSAPATIEKTSGPELFSKKELSLLGDTVAAPVMSGDSPIIQSSANSYPVARPRSSSDEESERSESRLTHYEASTSVPLDSWIYPIFDRLEALGYIPTSSTIIRPWTRLECARLLSEAYTYDGEKQAAAVPLLGALNREFLRETDVIDGDNNASVGMDNFYSRFTGISGTPLRDSFHFGQTLADDFGRPYGRGANHIVGASVRAEAGPLAFYFRGEYQYASSLPIYNAVARQTLADYDRLPFGWNLRAGTTSRVRPVEAYAAINLANWQLSFGQQALWWGPGRTTSLILSDNAAPMPMLKLSRARPIALPGILSWAGVLHVDVFASREGGIHYVGLGPGFLLHGDASTSLTPPPYLWGAALSIKSTPNLELGFAHTVIFAGYGRPLNLRTFFHTFSVLGNGQDIDPGKRVTEFNFAYHPPGLRKLVVYDEAMAWDDPIQGKFVARYAMAPGIYLPKLPRLPKLDLRAEGVYTNLPKLIYPAYFYSNAHYPQGYTNYGQILGSWVGRQGSGGQASSTYWFTARNKATVSYRKVVADKSYLKGGNQSIVSGSATWLVRPDIELSATSQYERWNFPLLRHKPTSDFTGSFEFRIYPKFSK